MNVEFKKSTIRLFLFLILFTPIFLHSVQLESFTAVFTFVFAVIGVRRFVFDVADFAEFIFWKKNNDSKTE